MQPHFTIIMLSLPVLILLAFSDTIGVCVSIRHEAPTYDNEKLIYLHFYKPSYFGHTHDFQELNRTLSMPAFRGAVNRAGLREFADFLYGLSKETFQKLSDLYDKPYQRSQEISDAVGSENRTKFKRYMSTFTSMLEDLEKYELEVSYASCNETGQIKKKCPCQLCIRDDTTCIDLEESILDFVPAERIK